MDYSRLKSLMICNRANSKTTQPTKQPSQKKS